MNKITMMAVVFTLIALPSIVLAKDQTSVELHCKEGQHIEGRIYSDRKPEGNCDKIICETYRRNHAELKCVDDYGSIIFNFDTN